LKGVADRNNDIVQTHVAKIVEHAELIQNSKAKAYKHNFAKSSAAIKAALRSLANEMTAGHNHDLHSLRKARSFGHNTINTSRRTAQSTVGRYRARACPAKRKEESSKARRDSALRSRDAIKRRKICSGLRTTWYDMDVDKSTPKFGVELRNKWDSARGQWVRANNKYNYEVKRYNAARVALNKAMTAFKTSLSIEASNANTLCKNAHKEFNTLCRDVQSNVKTRKQTFIATLVITCYTDNLTSNSRAKACANNKRRTNTSRWNINCGSLGSCPSKSANMRSFGPSNWTPSRRNC